MKRIKIFLAALLLGLVAMPERALGWGQEGHRIIAKIAYDHLSPVARCRVNRVLGAKEGAVYVATWADEIKSDTIYRESHDWHFQDFDGGLSDSAVVAALTDYPSEGGNLFRAADSLVAVLKNNRNDAVALRFLIHLTGDRFCPMHTAHMDDLGGNRVRLKWFGQQTSLHSVWDSKLIDSQGYSYTEYASYLEHQYRGERKALERMSAADLLLHNYHTTAEIYAYQESWNGNAYHYIYRWKEPMEYQLYAAGIYLARVLEALY